MDWKRLITGLSVLLLLTGALFVCFTTGGLLNRTIPRTDMDALAMSGIYLGMPGPVIGFVLMGAGAVGFVVVFSMKKHPPFPRGDAFDAFSVKRPSVPPPQDRIEPHG